MKKKHESAASGQHHPHDKLVKTILSDVVAAKEILSLYLPKEVLAVVDLNQLSLQKDTFIDDENRSYAVDLLYKTQIKTEDAYIWVLIEHLRNPDYWTPARLFHYIGIIWSHLRKYSKNKKLPLIYPLVIFNGDKPYAHSMKLVDLIEPQEAKDIFATLFTRPFNIVDLPNIDDHVLKEQLQGHVRGIALLMTLKHVFNKEIQQFFDNTLVKVLKELEESGDLNPIVNILYYLLKEAPFLEEGQFLTSIHNHLSRSTEGEFMTIAQQIEERALKQGIQQGIERAQYDIAERLIAKNQDIKVIAEATGLPLEKIKELKEKSH